MKNIVKIEEHLFENKNHTVRIEYRIFVEPCVYDTKTRSQLNKQERMDKTPNLEYINGTIKALESILRAYAEKGR